MSVSGFQRETFAVSYRSRMLRSALCRLSGKRRSTGIGVMRAAAVMRRTGSERLRDLAMGEHGDVEVPRFLHAPAHVGDRLQEDRLLELLGRRAEARFPRQPIDLDLVARR